MNLGQRIWQKVQALKEIDEEIKEVEAIIDQIDENERSVPEIDLNLDLATIYKELEEYIKIVDEKLFEIQKKYFEPNGLHININICKTELYDGGHLSVDSRGDSANQLELDLCEPSTKLPKVHSIKAFLNGTNSLMNFDEIEYEFCAELFYKWEEYLLDNLLAALNINKLAMMLGAMWYINDYEDNRYKLIDTNRDT